MLGDGIVEAAALSPAWPNAVIRYCYKSGWDLGGPMPPDMEACDVGLICNTFMCSRDPMAWLRHISAVTPVLIVQDLAVSKRGRTRHCSIETGDVARYSVSSHGIIGQTDQELKVFDFSECGYDLLDAEGYEDGEALKFVAVLALPKI
jgi:hypothetical protein